MNYQTIRCHVQENIRQKYVYINFMPINTCVSKGASAFNNLQGHLENVTCISDINVDQFYYQLIFNNFIYEHNFKPNVHLTRY
jgi:hypothetical protein